MFGNKKKEVFLTNKAGLYGEVVHVLEQEKIPFQTKTVNHGSRSRRTGAFVGSFGENPAVDMMYYIYVSEADEPRAKHLINEYMRNRNN